MSSFHSTGDAPTQRVPAWKRLGLKLKPASEGQSQNATHPPASTTTSTSSPVSSNRTYLAGSTPNAKRRASGGVPALDHSAKRARQDNWQDQTSSQTSHQTPKKAKSVSFAADTAEAQTPASVKTKQPKQTSAKGAVNAAPIKPIKKSAPVNLEPALAYLRTWHTAREDWKFNKNHQTKLLEQVFAGADETTIPAADINVFYEYIQGLQGGVRTRLRELANGIKTQDMEQGAGGFAASGKEMAERKQKEYEGVIRAFLNQTRTPEKRRFDEVEYVLRTTDMEMQRRVVKRMRAEMVLDELSETDSSETTTTTTTTTSGESSTTEKGNPSGHGADDNKRLQLNDDPGQRTKRKRKLRTAAVEEDTSSESESESDADSDTSSSGSSSGSSSSDEDEDEGARANEDTSSSSSSSSSESESDSDDSDED
ncbi:hypothetical protein FHL15_003407 [Xylaria flabelliformis]|uniref:WKF domain-containing protein n=1 Tax=Xylaria flabelliformis TaxID=2512241 RepID=A0A553I6N2_9PEZI|nr:hypothetical protein FHL15_003407 [Xylaria flabelliformis]